ncbi:hypothetical protein [Thalassoporum mexicanum]|nr:hypothetical protein [Pseudanabaena sp. PCC 7367]
MLWNIIPYVGNGWVMQSLRFELIGKAIEAWLVSIKNDRQTDPLLG